MSLLEKFREAVHLVDLNRDGIPDVEQPWLAEVLWQGALFFARGHLEEGHPIRVAMETGELVRARIAAAAADDGQAHQVEVNS